MRINQRLFIGILCLVLYACGAAPPGETGTDVYIAENIDNRQIQFVWIEIPSKLDRGSNEIRLFMARLNPPGMLVPTETELPCLIKTEGEYMDLRPITMPVDFDGEQVEGSYTWNACASCIECYMDWDTTLEFTAEVGEDKMDLSIGIRHMGHNIQDKYLQVELSEGEPGSFEPRILCRRSFDCQDVEFVPRQVE
jgi:hypothetical protein